MTTNCATLRWISNFFRSSEMVLKNNACPEDVGFVPARPQLYVLVATV